MNTHLVREKLLSILTDLKSVSLVYLFGSQIEGHVGPMSDYDVGVWVDRDADERQIQARLAHDLRRALKTERVDVLILNHAPIELAYAIVAQGQNLYQRDVATRVEYETWVMNRYGDYLPVLRAQRQEILRGDKDAKRVQRYRTALGRTERTLGQIAAAQRKEPRRV
jgi:predicted nucleotidyltransferase